MKFSMKYAGIIVVGICVAFLIKSFISETFTPRFLNFEINVWLYRTIWASVGVFSLYDFYKKRRSANLKK